MAQYPVSLTPDDNGTFLVTFPDFPEATTYGDNEAEALARAVDALETVIDAYIRDKRAIPAPSAVTCAGVTLPALIDTKVQIYSAMHATHVGKAELAKRLNVYLPQIDRLLDVRHGSKFDQLEAAARALGSRLRVTLDPLDDVVFGGKATTHVYASKKRVVSRRATTRRTVAAAMLAAHRNARPASRRSSVGGSKKK